MPLHIVIDARRIRDFGIGTYIRSLVHALSDIDQEDAIAGVRRRVEALTSRFPLYAWKREPARA